MDEQSLWIDYFRELDTTGLLTFWAIEVLWIDYFRELDTTKESYKTWQS